jgi:uncharacterized glyoxalase superfamily protein PhnB
MDKGASMPAIYPFMGYRAARAAIEWLCRAFGFQQHAVYDGPDGRVAHAELKLGPDAVVMLGSIQHDTLSLRVPLDIGAVTGGIYAAVEDLDAHYQRAKAAGARIVQELTDDGYGRRYSAHDLEGHLWAFGDYRPQQQ